MRKLNAGITCTQTTTYMRKLEGGTHLYPNNKDEHEELVDALQVVGALHVPWQQGIVRRLGRQDDHQLHQQHGEAH